MRTRLAVVTVFLAAAGCGQSPDDDNARFASQSRRLVKAEQDIRDLRHAQSGSNATSAPKSSYVVTYELQGMPGDQHTYPSQEKCEAARTAALKAQAKADEKRSDRFHDRPSPVCSPL